MNKRTDWSIYNEEDRNWYLRGYQDGTNSEPYEQAPEHSRGYGGSPDVPDSHLPPDWAAYMAGWSDGVQGAAAETLR